MFGPKREEVTGDWRKVHNEELHDSYDASSVTRRTKSWMRLVVQVARMVHEKIKILVGRPEGEKNLGDLDLGVR
jgi:hypothetical protein